MLTKESLRIDSPAVKRCVSNFLRLQVQISGASGVVLGISGGIDSSVVAALCADALGSDKVLGLLLPSETTDPRDMDDANSLAEVLQIGQEVVEIGALAKAFAEVCPHFDESDRVARGNLQPRFRMLTLYSYANRLNRIVAGSGDRSELLVGYFTKHGDGGVDILPIGDLYKTQVRQLAPLLDIPERIVQKASSPGFWSGQTAEGELGIKYEVLDLVLHGLVDLKMEREAICEVLKISPETVDKVAWRIKNSEHKRSMPPSPQLRFI
jgi:NAD+ synthase